MRLVVGLALTMLMACSGDSSDDAPTEATCDALQTTALGTVPVEEWPDGMVTVKDDVENLEGFYVAVDSCSGKETEVGITSVIQQDIQLVTTPYPAGAPCGCTQDPEFPPDANLEMTSQITNFTLVIDTFDDPFVQNFMFETTGATYSTAEPLLIRACASSPIDPAAGSKYSDVDMIFRMLPNRLPEVDIFLEPIDGSKIVSCRLTDFERQ
ncbi:MAG: hypothetical protein AAGA48_06695 [Myxococcota bacterium]